MRRRKRRQPLHPIIFSGVRLQTDKCPPWPPPTRLLTPPRPRCVRVCLCMQRRVSLTDLVPPMPLPVPLCRHQRSPLMVRASVSPCPSPSPPPFLFVACVLVSMRSDAAVAAADHERRWAGGKGRPFRKPRRQPPHPLWRPLLRRQQCVISWGFMRSVWGVCVTVCRCPLASCMWYDCFAMCA